MGGDHRAVGSLVEFHAELVQPFDRLGSEGDELLEQLGLCGEVSAAEGVEVVDCGGIAGLVGCLDSALRHHRVCVADAELGDDHNVGSRLVCLDRRGRARTAAADHEHIDVVIGVGEINSVRGDAALSLKERGKLMRHLFALVRADQEAFELVFLIVGMIRRKESVLLLSRHTSWLKHGVLGALCLDLFH